MVSSFSGSRVLLLNWWDCGRITGAASLGSAKRYVTVILLCGTPQHSTVSARMLATSASTMRRLVANRCSPFCHFDLGLRTRSLGVDHVQMLVQWRPPAAVRGRH